MRRWAGIAGALGVALGAFGAHGLKRVVDDPHLLEVWDTGARYHLVHAVALLALSAVPNPPPWTARLWGAGVVVFSGSLYVLALTDQRWLGAITPIGGVLLIAGWVSLAGRAPAAGVAP
jgi:uncharacterized membrane protein YgdD (TMEM256/DUF423 family)